MKSCIMVEVCQPTITGESPQKTRGTPPTIPHSEVALIVNDVFDPMYGYHKGDESKALEFKKRFLGLREKLKSLVNLEIIVRKWSNCLTTPLKSFPIYIKIPQ